MSSWATAARSDWRGWVGLASRLVLGGVLLVAGLLKVGNLGESVVAVQAYRLLPYELTTIVGYALPLVEIFIGLLLLTGLFTRSAGIVGGLLMVAFIIGISSAWARGLSLDCGCFGGGGEIPLEEALAAYPWEIARDVGLLATGAWLGIRPATPFAVDNLRRPPGAPGPDSPLTDTPFETDTPEHQTATLSQRS
ncbi:MAG: MauE/DoxX family redox-associated membrane protein [Propioniciclava sp.]